MKTTFFALIGLLLFLQYKLWFTNDGNVSTVLKLSSDVDKQRAHNQNLARRNQDLEAEITELKQTEAAMEGRARMDLGMVKQGEVFYQVVE
ncbi:MAG: septum formation initiator family protein [Gammaproteobacteria bacterium]